MSARLAVVVVAVVLASTPSFAAQQASLVNLATKEAERRQSVAQPSKVYTNADLKPAELNPGSVTTVAATAPLIPPPTKSDHDVIRDRGADDFERAVIVMAQQADDLDTQRRRYRSACAGKSSPRIMSGRWFWIDNESLPECLVLRSDIASLAKAIRTEMAQALEDARRADVYPGTVRDLRRKYALDGADWDR